jgi:hypothetical protein
VATETGNKRKIETELLDEPLNSRSRLASKNLSEREGLTKLGRLDGVLEESIDGVLDAKLHLGLSKSTVDTGGGLSRVTTHEAVLINKNNVGALLETGVSSGEASETTTNNNNLIGNRHYPVGEKLRVLSKY